jgi:hypothetical protein
MKTITYIFLSTFLIFSCSNSETDKSKESSPDDKSSKTTTSQTPDDDRVSGFFTLVVGDKTYKSDQLQDNYCDMAFNYNEDKSFVSIRFRDVGTRDALLVALYGDESYISNPKGKIEHFMFSGPAERKANIQFLPGDGKGSMTSTSMVEGRFTITKFDDGVIAGSFEGLGALPKDVVTKQNLIPFEGEINLQTKNVTKYGLE